MAQPANVDDREIDRFGRLAELWWDPKGPMRSLHAVNPLRMEFIARNMNLRDCRVLDVGCGGGILAEGLARLGAQVTGIDLSESALETAKQHAREHGLHIAYRYANAAAAVQEQAGRFDVVTCMEVLEHIPDPSRIVAACAQLLRSGGHAFFSTINRNAKAFVFAIVGAEYVLGLLQRGSHRYGRLIRPNELRQWADANGLEFASECSIVYNPFKRMFSVVDGVDVNYMMKFVRR